MKKEIAITITDQKLYDKHVVDVDVSGLKTMGLDYRGDVRGFRGDIAIELEEIGWAIFSGKHGSHDYENVYGFILTY